MATRHHNLYPRVSFRLVCPAFVVGGLIGRSGSIISSLRSETKCGILCGDEVRGSVHRIITVSGSGSIDRRIMFRDNDVVEEGGEVSSTQDAVIRVFERMWEVEAASEGQGDEDTAYCGLLVKKTKIGFVIGRRGRNVKRMRINSGARILMLPPPTCAATDDELIQITGATLAVKKALVAVTACLQELSPLEKDPILSRAIPKVDSSSSSDPHRIFSPHLSLLPQMAETSVDIASEFHSSSADADTGPSLDKKSRKQEVTLRMIVSDLAVSGIIGKRGAFVRSLENASGARISSALLPIRSGERVVTISAMEDLDTRHSPVQNAAVLVFARSVEVESHWGLSKRENQSRTVSVRVLVGANSVTSLTGNGNSIVSEIADVTGTNVMLVGTEHILGSAAQNDVVIQITGEYRNVQNALSEVARRLRHHLSSGEVLDKMSTRSPKGRVGETTRHRLHKSVAASSKLEQESITIRGVDPFGPSKRSPGLQTDGTRHETPITVAKPESVMPGGSLETEMSLGVPTEVVDDVRPDTYSGSMGKTTASAVHQPSDQFLDIGEDNMLTGVSQLGLFDNIIGPSVLQPPKTEGRGDGIPTTEGGSSSTTRAESKELESGTTSLFVANTNSKTAVGKHLIGSVYGEEGSSQTRFRGKCFYPKEKATSLFVANTSSKTVVGKHIIGSVYGEEGSNQTRPRGKFINDIA